MLRKEDILSETLRGISSALSVKLAPPKKDHRDHRKKGSRKKRQYK